MMDENEFIVSKRTEKTFAGDSIQVSFTAVVISHKAKNSGVIIWPVI